MDESPEGLLGAEKRDERPGEVGPRPAKQLTRPAEPVDLVVEQGFVGLIKRHWRYPQFAARSGHRVRALLGFWASAQPSQRRGSPRPVDETLMRADLAPREQAMTEEPVRYELIGAVARITLDRPEQMNSLNAAMRRALAAALQRAAGEARAIVLTGAGDAFSAGQDIGSGRRLTEIELGRLADEELTPLVKLIAGSPVPVIAAVNGTAAGTGCNLALAADVVVAAASAVFVEAFGRIGLIPDAGGTWVLPRLVGRARAMGMALFGDRIDAVTAQAWGLIWEVVPDALLDDRAMALAARLAEGPPLAHAALKEALAASGEATLEEQLATEARLQGPPPRAQPRLPRGRPGADGKARADVRGPLVPSARGPQGAGLDQRILKTAPAAAQELRDRLRLRLSRRLATVGSFPRR